jgi:hypothetical protein
MNNELIAVDTIKSTKKLIYWVETIPSPVSTIHDRWKIDYTIENPYVKQNKYLNKKTMYYLDILSQILNNHELKIIDVLDEVKKLDIPKRLKPTIKDITSGCLNTKLKCKIHRNINNKIIKIIELKRIYKENNVYCNIIENQLKDFKKELSYIEKIKVYEITFKDATVSYMEQKNLVPKIVMFLKDLRQTNGMEFKEYVDKWVDRLIKEYFVSTQEG